MKRSMSIVIALLLISNILSAVGNYRSIMIHYIINRPAHKCLSSLNYYKKSTLEYLRNRKVTVPTLYAYAIRDLKKTSSHNLRLLNDAIYGCYDTVYCDCKRCAALAAFEISFSLEGTIMTKFIKTDNPDILNVSQTYRRNQNDGRKEMCRFREKYPTIMNNIGLNEKEEHYIEVLCDYYLE